MIDTWMIVTYGSIAFLVARQYAGDRYRKEQIKLEKWRSGSQYSYDDMPYPAFNTFCTFVAVAITWPIVLSGAFLKMLDRRFPRLFPSIGRGVKKTFHMTFLAPPPKRERKLEERKKLLSRVGQLEKELDLDA